MKTTDKSYPREPLVHVIVSNHNGLLHLEECFSSLLNVDYENYRVLMMDNASTDGSREFVRKRFPSVIMVHNRKNLWFAPGMNVAMRFALEHGAEFVALLNNDTIVDKDWLREMVKVITSSTEIGAVASRLMYYTNRKIINGIGDTVSTLADCADRYQGELFTEAHRKSEEVPAFCGGACLLRAEALREVGLFDPYFYAYCEDVDLAFRMGGAGWRIVTAPDSFVLHKHSAWWGYASPGQRYMTLRNKMLLMIKYWPLEVLARSSLKKHLRQQLNALNDYLSRWKWEEAVACIRAHLAVIRYIPRAVRFRKKNRGKYGWALYERLVPITLPLSLPYLTWDYKRPSPGERFPERIIFGVSDGVLGDGWLPLDTGSYPQYRWMGDNADCFLGAKKGQKSIIQIHVSQSCDLGKPQKLSILMDGELLDEFEIPHGEWRTYQIKCVPPRDTVNVTFKLDSYLPADMLRGRYDQGLRFNEISLLPEGSPFIRRAKLSQTRQLA